MAISDRKSEHLRLALKRQVHFRDKTTGFEAWDFVHCALPELDFAEINTETEFLGEKLSFPLIISAMTGGFRGAVKINQQVAEVCRSERVAMGVGSERQILESDRFLQSYRIARQTAPESVIIGNMGGTQLLYMEDMKPVQRMVDLIEANAMAVHLNPLQELLQPEGDKHFTGVLKAIERLVKTIKVPVIVKEIGCGISKDTAKKLVSAGAAYIDVAGAGGTSWAGIESCRNPKNRLAPLFRDWGIPTAESVEAVAGIKGARVIASGGVDSGMVMAKAMALGAECCGAALPLLRALKAKKTGGLIKLIREWRETLKMVMFLTGCGDIGALRQKKILKRVEKHI